MNAIIINPEFRDLIPPLAESELEQLHRSLDARGCLSPLLVWREKGILIDGHNRHSYCEANEIPYEVKEVSLSSEDIARNFIILTQLGRRNMAPDAQAILRGKLYQGRKKTDSERVSESNKGRSGEAQSDTHRESTAEIIAKETGVSPATVKRDAKFAEAAEELGVTQDILAGKETRSKTEIVKAAKDKNPPPAKPVQATPSSGRIPKWIPDDADRLWLMAKQELGKILPSDKSRVRVLNEAIAYLQNRIQANK